jgi:hypothetical protein
VRVLCAAVRHGEKLHQTGRLEYDHQNSEGHVQGTRRGDKQYGQHGGQRVGDEGDGRVAGGEQAPQPHLTAMKKLRIVRVGFGTS